VEPNILFVGGISCFSYHKTTVAVKAVAFQRENERKNEVDEKERMNRKMCVFIS
jgi:hypothetical protein